MNAVTTYGAVVAFALSAASVSAQVTKTLTSEPQIVTATVEAITPSSREMTVKKADGTYVAVYVPSEYKKFDSLKVGDKITAKYYETVVLRVKAPGEKDSAADQTSLTRAEGLPAGTLAHQQTVTVTITAIDSQAPSITFTGPRGWKYSSRVEDTKTLAKVKVGDKVDITWTEALILSLESAK